MKLKQAETRTKMYQINEIKNKILCGDAISELKKFESESVDRIFTY